MPRDGSITKTKIMDEAQNLFIDRGYAATSIEQIIDRSEITKGSFFYHFKGKGELALELVKRFAEADGNLVDGMLARAESLSRDPLQQMLIMMRLYEEAFEGTDRAPDGCLFAAYAYQSDIMSDEITTIIVGAIEYATNRIHAKLEEAAREHPPLTDVDLRSLALLFTTQFEGAFVMARTLPDPGTMLDQIRHYRHYLELIFGTHPRP